MRIAGFSPSTGSPGWFTAPAGVDASMDYCRFQSKHRVSRMVHGSGWGGRQHGLLQVSVQAQGLQDGSRLRLGWTPAWTIAGFSPSTGSPGWFTAPAGVDASMDYCRFQSKHRVSRVVHGSGWGGRQHGLLQVSVQAQGLQGGSRLRLGWTPAWTIAGFSPSTGSPGWFTAPAGVDASMDYCRFQSKHRVSRVVHGSGWGGRQHGLYATR
ncbi:hypothetical protein RRG08_045250 [Elysia crispata]|uniref:Uncharacterized protein n=1 Tax=Elysia crispata TaxID=231223 RepID=A0AAE1DQU3_9GAST|nr:hypothetical protein RRG08_045250 [Elysia crispata]